MGSSGGRTCRFPVWLFSWAAAIVLVVSFVALSTLWTMPQLQEQHRRALVRLPAALEWLACLVGVGLFVLVVYSGFAGAQVHAGELLGDVHLRRLLGRHAARERAVRRHLPRVQPVADVRAGAERARVARARARTSRSCRDAHRRCAIREWLGMWPSVATIVAFAWLELIYVPADREHPATLAVLSLAYFSLALAGMMLFGVEEWGGRADGFAAYFNLFSRLSADLAATRTA